MTNHDEPNTQAFGLTEFLLARIAEDENVARAAEDAFTRGVSTPPTWASKRQWERFDSAISEQIRRHGPARVLAQCAALREVVNEAAALLDSWDHVHEGTAGLAMWPDVNRRERSQAHRRLRALASIWNSHPDYPLED